MTLDAGTVEALRDINDVAEREGIRFVVVGALARDRALAALGEPPGRATRDVDLALRVQSWTDYKRLIDRATGIDRPFERSSSVHRITHTNGLPVDLVPFGPLESPPGSVKWPNEDTRLNVSGFEVVLDHAIEDVIDGSTSIPFADMVSLSFMKSCAYVDRKGSTRKDIEDLVALLRAREFHASPEDHRRMLELEEAYGEDVGGAFLTGHEAAERFTDDELAPVCTSFADAADPLSEVVDQGTGSIIAGREGELMRTSELLVAFLAGLTAASAS